jgi:rhamnopyranosyl-N-acetylglucosaminyl-diphospho-decaprenol beta-1,3/1,4-galactofuranosyltransferase
MSSFEQQVCAVTVAYNSPEELTRLLSSLQTQQALKGLVVIDNSYEQYLQNNQATFRKHAAQYQFSEYIHPEDNKGSAAGFCQGMKIAHEKGFDWVWLLDQDGIVENGCLASLLRDAGQANILCPQIVDIDHPAVVLPQSGAVVNFWGRMMWVAVTVSREISFYATHGALISKQVLDQVGYYDPHHFFVGSEDTDYAFRSAAKHKVIRLVTGAKARHPDPRYRSFEKRVSLTDAGVIDSILAQRGSMVANRLRPGLLVRFEVTLVESVSRLLPQHLGYVSDKVADTNGCRGSVGLASLSLAYVATKRLTTWQLGAACVWSLLLAFFRKLVGGKGISVRKTIDMYSVCFLSKLTKQWPFESVQQFCKYLVK